jgi:hypothetical protein
MASDAEEAFHKYLEESDDRIFKDGSYVKLYAGRLKLNEIDDVNIRTFLASIKRTMNVWLAERRFVEHHLDDLPFHFDYIESEFPNALAFRDDSHAFIGITIPLIDKMMETCKAVSQSARIRELLGLRSNIGDRVFEPFLFANLLNLVVTHEFTHHVHGHVARALKEKKFFSEFDANKTSGDMLRQAEEADADGYGTYHVLANSLDGDRRFNAVETLELSGRSAEEIDRVVLLCFVIVSCAYFSTNGLVNVKKDDPWRGTHPPEAARLDYLMRHTGLWCQANRPNLVDLISERTFTEIMEIVSTETWGVISEVRWKEQAEWLASTDGQQYRKELSRLIDQLKDRLGNGNDSANSAAAAQS